MFCPYGEWPVAQRLWRARAYRKWANYLLVEAQLARGHSWLLGKPYWLTVDPTNFCQLQCPFCPTGAGRGVRDKAMLRLDHFERLLERVGPYVIHMDLMNWGESLLNKDLPRMISCAKRYGIEVKLDANLNDLTEAMADGLIGSGLDILSVSIDGATPESYKRYRVGGDFDRVLANVRTLVQKRTRASRPTPRLIWQFIVFKHNEHEMKEARRLAAELGMDGVSFVAPFMANEPAVLRSWLSRLPEYQLYAAPAEGPADGAVPVQSIPSLKAYRARRFKPRQLLGLAALAPLSPETLERAWRALRQPAPAAAAIPYRAPAERPICKWPWAGMTVNPDGSVAPCCSVEDQGDDFGNAFRKGFSAIWNGGRYRRSRRHVRRYVRGDRPVIPDSDHVCERCTAVGYANFKFPEQTVRATSLREELHA